MLNHLTDPEIVAVPAAVMKTESRRCFSSARVISSRASCISRVKVCPHHMFAGVQRQAGQRGVRGVRGGDDHQVNVRMLDRCFRGGDHRDVRQVAFDLLFIAVKDEREFSPAPG